MANTPIYSSENPDEDISRKGTKKQNDGGAKEPPKNAKDAPKKKATKKDKPPEKASEKKAKTKPEASANETENTKQSSASAGKKDNDSQKTSNYPGDHQEENKGENEPQDKRGSKWKYAAIIPIILAAGAAIGYFSYDAYLKYFSPVSEVPVVESIPDDFRFQASTWFSDYNAMKKQVKLYDNIHPFIYGLQGGRTNNGKLTRSWSSDTTKARMKEMRELNPKIKIIPTIFRWENKNEQISEAIGMNGRNDVRDLHIQVILNEIETFDYDGIDIDYEGMSCDKKEKFEEFIVLLSKELKSRKKLLSVAVHPKTPIDKKRHYTKTCKGLKNPVTVDFKENWRGPMTHDYEFLARHSDMFKIMAYELHPRKYNNPGPGPQAPTYWLKDIIKYARKKVPARKLYMAIPTYGYDWGLNCRSKIRAVYFKDAQRIMKYATLHQPTDMPAIYKEKGSNWTNLHKMMYIHKGIVYDDPSLWYKEGGCDRVAFFMNRKAFESKMTVLRGFDLAGFSFWQLLSDNDPDINIYLKKLIEGKLPPVPKLDHELLEDIEDHSDPVGIYAKQVEKDKKPKTGS